VEPPNFDRLDDALEEICQDAFGSVIKEPAMNHSIYTADKATHVKVVVSVLLASVAIMAVTLTARLEHPQVSVDATASQALYKARPGHVLTEMIRIERNLI
jgi:hypothetical protein